MRKRQFANLLFAVYFAGACSNTNAPRDPELFHVSQLELNRTLADVWGYFDENTGTEYALVGYGLVNPENSGVFIVDASDAENPRVVSDIGAVPGFDVKTWKNYMYSVTGRNNGEGGIVDISDPGTPKVVGSFPTSHNIFISENGYLYSECPGLRIFDLNADPLNPNLIWSDGEQACHDAVVIGNRLFDFHGSAGTNIYDVSTPAEPVLLGRVNDPAIVFHHSGWVSEDGNFLYICDEGSRHPTADITVWNISDAGNPEFVADFKDSTAIVHNLYIIENYAFVAYYTSGFRVFDVSDPSQLRVIGEFDTSPDIGESFAGAFGAYPFTRSGNIFVSDMGTGLHIFSIGDRDQGTGLITP